MADTNTVVAHDEEMTSLMRYRATMYGLVARLFEHEADEALIGRLRAMSFPQNTGDDALDAAFRELYAYLRHAREDILEELATDYARTFLGSGVLNGNAAFPYESVYTSEHALVMQDARDQVLAIFRTNGMQPPTGWTDPEDHIALELDFMRTLCERTAEALEAGNDDTAAELATTQYCFLMLHPMRWAERFCLDVERFGSTGFYHAAAHLAAAFLANDLALLEDVMQASGVDTAAALETARAADAAVTAEMEQEAAREHLEPNVIIEYGAESQHA